MFSCPSDRRNIWLTPAISVVDTKQTCIEDMPSVMREFTNLTITVPHVMVSNQEATTANYIIILDNSQAIPISMTSADFTYMSVSKMEPQSPAVARANRKRNLSQVSWSSSSSVTSTVKDRKKVKKYELDPSLDPTIRNAVAAKANREKKKREEMALKEQNDALKTENTLLEKQLEESLKRQTELARLLEEERTKNTGASTGPFPQQSVDSFFQSVMGDISQMAEIPVENPTNFEDIDTSNWDIDNLSDIDAYTLFPSVSQPDKLEKPPSLTPIDECLTLFNETNTQDPLLPLHFNPSSNAELCESLNERMQCSPNLWDVIKSMSMASTPMGHLIIEFNGDIIPVAREESVDDRRPL
ncbi:unnamed protein product [Allacma fusca]|uniref:BZIP domain-containing protein n=1 Tax=Allacma fusca TaxID=39272 RepID=A0A8J2J008_9HEXA|nr:unnamed protein product [Allacma fusca]